MADVFVSYSSKDRDRVAGIVSALTNEGLEVFWDQEVPVGREWDGWIAEQLRLAKVVLVLWSPHSVASRNVRDEASRALDADKLIPAILDDIDVGKLPMGHREIQTVDLSDERKFADNTRRLATAIRSRFGSDLDARATRRELEDRVRELEAILYDYVEDGRQTERNILARSIVLGAFVTIFLVNGVKVQGVVRAFDQFTLFISHDGRTQIVYLHSIAVLITGSFS